MQFQRLMRFELRIHPKHMKPQKLRWPTCIKWYCFLLTLAWCTTSFSLQCQNEDLEALSTVIIQSNYEPWGANSDGMLILMNTKTKRLYENKTSLFFQSRFIIIENLPPGEYVVSALFLPTGGTRIEQYNDSLFDTIRVNEPKHYYLGNYSIKKVRAPVKPFFKFYVEVHSVEKNRIDKLRKLLHRRSEKWDKLEIDCEGSFFKSDTTLIKVID